MLFKEQVEKKKCRGRRMNVVEEVYAQHACTVVSYTKSMVVVGDVEGRFPRVREVWPGKKLKPHAPWISKDL